MQLTAMADQTEIVRKAAFSSRPLRAVAMAQSLHLAKKSPTAWGS
jgi:hypothetical protein